MRPTILLLVLILSSTFVFAQSRKDKKKKYDPKTDTGFLENNEALTRKMMQVDYSFPISYPAVDNYIVYYGDSSSIWNENLELMCTAKNQPLTGIVYKNNYSYSESSIYTYVNGKQEGQTMSFNRNGIILKANYKEGKRHGTYETFHKPWLKKDSVNFVNGKLHGLSISWDEYKVIQRETMFKNGLRNGLDRQHNMREAIWLLETNYSQDKRHGLCTAYDYEQKKCKETNYIKGTIDGIEKYWSYWDGKSRGNSDHLALQKHYEKNICVQIDSMNSFGILELESFYANNKVYKKKRYYASGELEMIENFKNGQSVGVVKSWYKDGKERSNMYYEGEYITQVDSFYNSGQALYHAKAEKGNYEGMVTSWYQSGQKKEEYLYGQGILNGVSLGWYNKGEPRFESHFTNGDYTFHKSWYQGGELESVAHYDKLVLIQIDSLYANGEKSAEYKYKNGWYNDTCWQWQENGLIISEIVYNEGEVELYRSFYPSGKPAAEIHKKNGKYHGTCKTWRESGLPESHENWKNGAKHGICKRWYSNGQLHSEADYEDWKKLSFQMYNEDGSKMKSYYWHGSDRATFCCGYSY